MHVGIRILSNFITLVIYALNIKRRIVSEQAEFLTGELLLSLVARSLICIASLESNHVFAMLEVMHHIGYVDHLRCIRIIIQGENLLET